MVLEVLADARQVVTATSHADRAQVVGRADARQHQQLRRADRAGAEDDLAVGADDLARAGRAVAQAHAGRAVARQLDAEHVRVA